MDKKVSLEFAENILRSKGSFIGDKNPNEERGAHFALEIEDDNEILMYNADFKSDTFYWAEDVVDVTRGLGLTFYITHERIQIGQDIYGKPIMKEVIAARIY